LQPCSKIIDKDYIFYFESIDSTNKFILDYISKNKPNHPIVAYTDYQTEGKGQIGRYWESETSKNLLMSLHFLPEKLLPENQFNLSMYTALIVATVLKSIMQTEVKIKWPNDIYIGDKKIAGILIQNVLQGKCIKNSVIGIGLNVNQTTFSDFIPNPTSMKLITNLTFEISKILDEICDLFFKNINSIYEYKSLKYNYISKIYSFREWKKYQKGEVVFEGMIIDIEPSGRLILELKNGLAESYNFQEIKLVFN